MNKFTKTLKSLAILVALSIFVGLFVVIFQNFVPGRINSQTEIIPTSNPNISVYPPPEETPSLSPSPLSIFNVSPTPRPTWTPFPTNTARPGPAYTPIPLVEPAQNSMGKIFFVTKALKANQQLNVLEMNDRGQSSSAVTIKPTDPLPEGQYYPSPDGKLVAIIWGTEGGFSGSLLELKSGNISPLLGGLPFSFFFNWYPDSQQVLVQNNAGGLWLLDAYGKKPFSALLSPSLGRVGNAASSPDGSKVIYSFVRDPAQPVEVWSVNSDGRDAAKLFDTQIPLYGFSWSPDGTQIAVFGNGLMVMNPDGSDFHTVFTSYPIAACDLSGPLWSPDSQKIAITIYETYSDTLCPGWTGKHFAGTHIAIIDVKSEQFQIIPFEIDSGDVDPSWSPDGKKITFVSNRNGAPNLWVAGVNEAKPYPITTMNEFVRYPSWQKP